MALTRTQVLYYYLTSSSYLELIIVGDVYILLNRCGEMRYRYGLMLKADEGIEKILPHLNQRELADIRKVLYLLTREQGVESVEQTATQENYQIQFNHIRFLKR